jgi:S-adenosylmethionine synthetase
VSDEKIAEALSLLCDFRPAAIIQKFDLRRPIYRAFAAYGHMGREDLSAPWEETDLAPKLAEALRG